MSYMELLYENARTEPRLRRLLGHVSIYENASRIYWERMQKIAFCLDKGEEKTVEDESRQSRPVRTSFTKAQRVQTFSDLQAMSQSKLEHQQLCNVTTTEITEDSDESDESRESDESEESEASESSNDDHDNGILNGNAHAVIERVGILMKASLSKDSDDLASQMSRSTITKGEQTEDEQLWEYQQQILTQRESEQAFHDVWL